MERRQALLDASQKAPAFLLAVGKNEGSSTELGEVMQGMSGEECASVWSGLKEILPDTLADATPQEVLELVVAVAKFGCVHLKVADKATPGAMKEVVQLLHDNLIEHVEFESPAQDAICRVCEAWFLGDCEDKSTVVPQTLVTLLMRSVGDNARVADVKRVWDIREALTCIELSGVGFRTVKESIMRAAIHPHYVMHDDGRRFLAFVLTLSPELTRAVHQSIKNQLPWIRASMLEQYGELYHQAWKKAAGPALHALEYDCFQDLANHCVHAATPALASALRKVLAVVHKHKKNKAVDEMLARVYEPVLWRSLKVANPTVRRQAALLFAEVFPVQDPDASNAEFEKSLTMQVFYKEAGVQAPAQAVVNLIVMLHHALMVCIQKRTASVDAGRKAGKRRSMSKAEEEEAEALAALLEGDDDEEEGGEGGEEDEALAALREAEEEEEAEKAEQAKVALAKANRKSAKAIGGEDLEEVAEDMLVCMAAMAKGLRARLGGKEEKALRKYLVENIPTDTMPPLIASFPTPTARRAIWRLAAALPEPAKGKDCDKCLARLLEMPAEESHEEAGPIIDCLVAWDRYRPLVHKVCGGVAAALGAEGKGEAGGKKKRRGEAAAADASGGWEDEGRAVWCAHYLFASEGARARVLEAPGLLDALMAALKAAMPAIERRLDAPGDAAASPPDALLLNALLLYAKGCLHAHCSEFPGTAGNGKAPPALVVLLKWCQLAAVPFLAASSAEPKRKSGKAKGKADAESSDGAALAAGVCRTVLMVAAEAAALNRADEELAGETVALLERVVSAGAPIHTTGLLQPVCKATYHVLRLGLVAEGAHALLQKLLETLPKASLRGISALLRDALALGGDAHVAKTLVGASLRREEQEDGADAEPGSMHFVVAAAVSGGSEVEKALATELSEHIASAQDLSALQAAFSMVDAMLTPAAGTGKAARRRFGAGSARIVTGAVSSALGKVTQEEMDAGACSLSSADVVQHAETILAAAATATA
ncbi:condensin II non structural maintenance of chromosomes subunit-domain-containing protein [Baffinella frigidus]|nr:condensin II non structural maintenance of chromosomes subunit-domain-containing protein [Cryptophyta sp. CCMP2293]